MGKYNLYLSYAPYHRYGRESNDYGWKGKNMKKALFYGILASFFFAFTFILNRSMNLAGGYWLWSLSLIHI